MSTDTPEQRVEVTPEWAPLPPPSPKPPRDPRRIALVAGAVTLAIILIATTVFALRGQSRPTTANTTAPTATTVPTATTAPTPTTAPTATAAPGTAPAAPVSVYFTAGNGGAGTLYAINPADGSVRWKNAGLNASAFTPAVGGNRVFVLVVNGPLIAFQALDGKELWRVPHPSAGAAPLLDGDILFTDTSGSVTAYSAASGAVLWQKDLGPNAFPHLAASGGAHSTSISTSPSRRCEALTAQSSGSTRRMLPSPWILSSWMGRSTSTITAWSSHSTPPMDPLAGTPRPTSRARRVTHT